MRGQSGVRMETHELVGPEQNEKIEHHTGKHTNDTILKKWTKERINYPYENTVRIQTYTNCL